ncbi:hypothetical protein C1645_814951 [Glomus cerebriforme]|uniref:Ion transport domain-containing protein n=1 Tax=Glomus cerebriforme TaxID=658196 RepID=A0A397TF45_9GLOM|nr:hypothetical protein C1645_814951 [Glomus cerebriforme]
MVILLFLFPKYILRSFIMASTLKQLEQTKILFIIIILLGIGYLTFEVRLCLWKPKLYFTDPWKMFDVGALVLPIITSMYWLVNGKPPLWIIAFSNLFLYFKFLLFFRVFKSFGVYFVLIIGVVKRVLVFWVILSFIIFGFTHAFFIMLRPTKDDKENDPWNLATKYNSINSNGTINPNLTLIQQPNSNTNMFSWFPTSILAMYLLLTGDSGYLSSWTYREAPIMTILLVLFTSFTTIYLMNLFIGSFIGVAIEDYGKNEAFLLQKAKKKIKNIFQIGCNYYDIPADEVRRLINAIDNNQTEFSSPSPIISKKLRYLLKISEPIGSIDELKQLKEEFKQLKEELKQRQIRDESKQQENGDEFRQQISGFSQ